MRALRYARNHAPTAHACTAVGIRIPTRPSASCNATERLSSSVKASRRASSQLGSDRSSQGTYIMPDGTEPEARSVRSGERLDCSTHIGRRASV